MDGSVLHELRIGRRTSLLLVAEGGDRPRRLDKHRGHASATVYGAAAPAAIPHSSALPALARPALVIDDEAVDGKATAQAAVRTTVVCALHREHPDVV